MYRFHVTIHVRPPAATDGDPVELDGRVYRTLRMPPEGTATPFPVSFENAAEVLAALPRLFLEPDGSFVWVADDPQRTWQVDGHLFDRAGQLLFAELKGACPAEAFDHLLGALGWPRAAVVFQLVRQGIYLDEVEFRGQVLHNSPPIHARC